MATLILQREVAVGRSNWRRVETVVVYLKLHKKCNVGGVDQLCSSTFTEVSKLVFTALSNYDNGIIYLWKEARILEEAFFYYYFVVLGKKETSKTKDYSPN